MRAVCAAAPLRGIISDPAMKTSPDDDAAAGAAALGAAPSQSALSVMASRTAPASLPSSAKQPLQEKETQKQQWNTKNLPARLAADLASATTAGALIAPIISIIDRSVPETPPLAPPGPLPT